MISLVDPELRMVRKWAAIAGNWSFDGPHATYLGPSGGVVPYGLALTDVELRDGAVSVMVSFDSDKPAGCTGGIVLGYQSESSPYITIGLGGHDYAYGITEYTPALGWRALIAAGSIANLAGRIEYPLEVTQLGQKLFVSVDGVRIFEHVLGQPLAGNQVGLYAYGETKVSFTNAQAQRKQPRAFVAMQFTEPFDTLYRRVIKPRATKLGFDVVRIDEVAGPGIIFQDIQREIAESMVVIAEITAPNQNVFYELGYAHALNKPTILLARRQKDAQLPFDIRSYRVIFYDDTIGGKVEVEQQLQEHLSAIMNDL